MRNGDFSGLVNGAGIQQILYDPNTTAGRAHLQRTPFPNNQIPITRDSPLAKALYAATPLPQTSDNPLVNSNFNAVNNTTQTVPNITIRLDHVFNQNNRMYFRFTDIDQQQQALRNYPANSPANIAGGGLPAGATGYQAHPDSDHQRRAGLLARLFADLLFRDHPEPAMAADVCAGKRRRHSRTTKQQLGLPNNFGQIGFPDHRREPDHALRRFSVELRHEPDSVDSRREHEQDLGQTSVGIWRTLSGTNASAISPTARPTPSRSPIRRLRFTIRPPGPTMEPSQHRLSGRRLLPGRGRVPTPRRRTRLSATPANRRYDFYIQDNYRVSQQSHGQRRAALGDASGAPRRQTTTS